MLDTRIISKRCFRRTLFQKDKNKKKRKGFFFIDYLAKGNQKCCVHLMLFQKDNNKKKKKGSSVSKAVIIFVDYLPKGT